MSEHIVARALRARASTIRRECADSTSMQACSDLMLAQQFEHLADELASIDNSPVLQPPDAPGRWQGALTPSIRVTTDPRHRTLVEMSSAGTTITIGADRLRKAAERMCDAYEGNGTWAHTHAGLRMQWEQLARIAIEAALGPDHD